VEIVSIPVLIPANNGVYDKNYTVADRLISILIACDLSIYGFHGAAHMHISWWAFEQLQNALVPGSSL
jgi:hypothetical protein